MSSPPPKDQLNRLGPLGGDCADPAAEGEVPPVPEKVDAQLESRAADADQQAAGLELQADQRVRRTQRLQKRREIRSDLEFMISANLQASGRGVYAGFRFVRAGGIEASPDEEPYVGAFLPLKVAARFPRLMGFTTVSYEDVFVNEQLNPGTRTVVRPGKFRRYGIASLISKLTSLPTSTELWSFALAAGALLWLVMWLKRWH